MQMAVSIVIKQMLPVVR